MDLLVMMRSVIEKKMMRKKMKMRMRMRIVIKELRLSFDPF